MPKKKPTPIEPYHTDESVKKGMYIRFNSQLNNSYAFQQLSPSGRYLYLDMWIEAGSKKVFTYPHNKYSAFLSTPTFLKQRDELIKKGFIKITENNANLRKANIYEFIEDWKFYK